jgi:hypothetical protein
MSAGAAPLDALQRWMLDALAAPGNFDRASVAERLLPGPQLDAGACLAIYRRSYVLRLRKCLAAQFPATRHALGAALFDDFADAYLRACPPDSYTLDALGRRFAGWLEETRIDRDRPVEAREDWIDFMVDLARYERELFVLYDAPGHEAGLPPGCQWPAPDTDDAALTLQRCLVLKHYRHAVPWYYHEVRAGRRPGFPPPAEMHAVILRRDYRTVTYPVGPLHFRFLEAVRARGNVAAALADVAAWTGRPLEAVVRSWQSEVRRPWIDAGFFVADATTRGSD